MKSHKEFSRLLSKYETLFLLALALIVILIYANTLSSPFVFDSRSNIESNPHIRITKITLDDLAGAAFKSPSSRRPVSNISFALNYFIHGYNVVGFHVVNMLIHIITGFILYLFVKTTFCTPVLKSRYSDYMWISFFTAAIWMIHPVQTQSISYVVQRMNSLAVMFYMLSIWLYARFRLNRQPKNKWWLLSGCILAGVLALLTKEIAATLPFFIIIYEWYFFRDLKLEWVKRNIPMLTTCLVLSVGLALIFLGGNPVAKILEPYESRDFTLSQRLLTEPRVVIFYLSLLFWPHPSRLNLDHDFPLSHSLMDPLTTSFSILVLAVMFIAAVFTAKRQRLLSFGILWFFGNLAIESTILALEIVFEHRLYLPSMMISLIVVMFVYRFVKPIWLKAALLAVVVAVCAVWTYERNMVYRDRITLWQDCVDKSPRKARPYHNLGVALADYGYHDEALKQYHKALQIKPDYQDAIANIGLSMAQQGKVEESIPQFLKALEINPKDSKTLNNLAASLILTERFDEAVERLSEALKLNPYYDKAHNNLGVALRLQDRNEEAIHHFTAAVLLNPDHAEAYNNLGMALAAQGKFEEAIDQFSAALEIAPGYRSARLNLEKTLKEQNN